MKKTISLILVMILLFTGLFVLTGCDNAGSENGKGEEKAKSSNTVEISKAMGKGTFTISVPKKEDGTAKYEFTDKKPEGANISGTFYLVTDNTIFTFSTSGLVYNTSKDYKAKYGETKATFDGYLDFIDDTSISSRPRLAGMEKLEINGRKAIRYYNRTGGSGDYKYHGYNYVVGVDDIYPGSDANVTVVYKDTNYPSEAKEFDAETLEIINSLKITLNQ